MDRQELDVLLIDLSDPRPRIFHFAWTNSRKMTTTYHDTKRFCQPFACQEIPHFSHIPSVPFLSRLSDQLRNL